MRPSLTRVALVLAALFAFRLLFGLCSEFFTEDETQIYLLGLPLSRDRALAVLRSRRGLDPERDSRRAAGAAGRPAASHLAPVPEAPFVLLNLLSFAALSALA